jgi:hypothetical protein
MASGIFPKKQFKKRGLFCDLFAKFAKKVNFWRGVLAGLCRFYGNFLQMTQILGGEFNGDMRRGGKWVFKKTPGSLQSRAERIT